MNVYYDALSGHGYGESAADLARAYADFPGTIDEKISNLIRAQCKLAAGESLSANLLDSTNLPNAPIPRGTSIYLIQLRLVLAIAIMQGYDPRKMSIRTLAFACMLGSRAESLLANFGIQTESKSTAQAIEEMSPVTPVWINEAVFEEFDSITEEARLPSVFRLTPFMNAALHARADFNETKDIGAIARKVFQRGSNAQPSARLKKSA